MIKKKRKKRKLLSFHCYDSLERSRWAPSAPPCQVTVNSADSRGLEEATRNLFVLETKLSSERKKKKGEKRQEVRGVTQWRSFNSWARVDEHLLSVWHRGAKLIGSQWRRSALWSGSFCLSRLCLCYKPFPRGDSNQPPSPHFFFNFYFF